MSALIDDGNAKSIITITIPYFTETDMKIKNKLIIIIFRRGTHQNGLFSQWLNFMKLIDAVSESIVSRN